MNFNHSEWIFQSGDNPAFSANSFQSSSRKKASDFIVRKAKQEDLNSLAEVLTNSFHPRDRLNLWLHYLLRLGIYEDLRYRLRYGAPYHTCLVATIGSNSAIQDVVGTVEIDLRKEFSWSGQIKESPYISNLAVKDSYRRLGIATMLLTKCEQISLEWGFNEIYLHVLDNNYHAKQLYINSGYQISRIESSIGEWLLQRPKKLLLVKKTRNFS